jgi:exodeoxyribonuclease-3
MIEIASWNVNSIRARLEHITAWPKARQPDVLLLQELKGTEFPAYVFQQLVYGSVAVTQKAYNGLDPLSPPNEDNKYDSRRGRERQPFPLPRGDDRCLRVVNIYLPNGNPVGSDNFAYKLAWMDRLHRQLKIWEKKDPRL